MAELLIPKLNKGMTHFLIKYKNLKLNTRECKRCKANFIFTTVIKMM